MTERVATGAEARTAALPSRRQSTIGPLTRSQWAGLLVVALLMLPPIWMGEFGTLVLQTGALYVIAVLGLHILIHWAGQISLGHDAFVALGAFLTANFAAKLHFPFWAAVLAAAGLCVLASIVVGLPALRIRGFNLAITTLALGLAADRWLFRQEWLSGGSSGIRLPKPALPGVTFGTSRATYYLVLIPAVLLVLLAIQIRRSKAGRAFLAIRADEDVAASWGINVAWFKLLAFMVAGGFAGVAGALTAYSVGIVGPQTFPVTRSIEFVAAVVIAGPGGVWGTVAAAALFGMLPSIQAAFGRFSTLVGALGSLAVIVQYPGGLNEVGARLASRARELAKARDGPGFRRT